METASIDHDIRSFLVENFLFGRADQLKDDEYLLGSIVDSTGTIELVMFLQDRFAITVEDEDVVPQNFGSVKSVVAYVTEKVGQRDESIARPSPTTT
jgi:acyl carrier protein